MTTLARITGRILRRGQVAITSDDLAIRIGDGETPGEQLPVLAADRFATAEAIDDAGSEVGVAVRDAAGETQWDPGKLPGADGFWDAQRQFGYDVKADGDAVSTWPNLVTGGPSLTQGTASKQPRFRSREGAWETGSVMNALGVLQATMEGATPAECGWESENVANGTVALSTAEAASGTKSLAVTAVGAGSWPVARFVSVGLGSLVEMRQAKLVPVTIELKTKAVTTPRNVWVIAQWRDWNNVAVGADASINAGNNSTAGWTRAIHANVPRPNANAAFLSVSVMFANCANGEVHRVDEAAVYIGQTVAPPVWSAPRDSNRVSAVQFDGIDDCLSTTDIKTIAPRTEWYVAGFSQWDRLTGTIIGSTDGAAQPRLAAAATTAGSPLAASGTATLADDSHAVGLKLVIVEHNGADSSIEVDGHRVTGELGSLQRIGLRLGNNAAETSPARCEIGALGICRGLLSEADKARLRRWAWWHFGTRAVRWADEFDGPAGSAPDPTKWTYDLGGGGWGNSELQSYTSSRQNADLDGAGNLRIRARRESTGPNTYTSARLKTQGLAEFLPTSRIEARVDHAAGAGIWPAVWMMGTSLPVVGWPMCGEIDLMEIGKEPTGEAITCTVHSPKWDGSSRQLDYWVRTVSGLATGYHIYTLEWHHDAAGETRRGLRIRVDGRPFVDLAPTDLEADYRWADGPMFLLLNMAVGGTFTGNTEPPGSTIGTIATTLIDWVRYSR